MRRKQQVLMGGTIGKKVCEVDDYRPGAPDGGLLESAAHTARECKSIAARA
jgi:hypothetical protein